MAAMDAQACDVWLLTEVPIAAAMDGYVVRSTDELMTEGRHWAAVAVRQELEPRCTPDPHPASAALLAGGITYCSSVLPWRSSGGAHPWRGASVAERTAYALDQLTAALPAGPLVWGGDWNHALEGPELAGSNAGREAINEAVSRLGLSVLTAGLPHRLDGHGSIDHLAVPVGTPVVRPARQVPMQAEGRHLSDHDAYVVEVSLDR